MLSKLSFFFGCFLPVLLFAQQGTWTTFKHMPTSRQEMPCAVLNGKIYVSGGIILASANKTEVYDPASDSWSLAAPMPDSRHHHMMATVNGRIYAIGGFKSVISFDARDNVWEYDDAANAWTERAPLPIPVGAGAAVAYENKVYVFGGDNDDDVLDNAFRYDPLIDEWTELAPMPTRREHLAAAVLDSLIYVVGGRGTFDAGVAMEIYSPATDTWRQAATMPTPRSGLGAAGIHGRIFAFGGEGGGIHAENEAYDAATDTWSTAEPLPTPRHGFTTCILDGNIFLPGGGVLEGYGPSNVVEAYSVNVLTGITESSVSDDHFAHYLGDGNIQVRFSTSSREELYFELLSMDGRVIDHLSSIQFEKGTHRVNLGSPQLESGLYLYTINGRSSRTAGSVFIP